ncbi:integrase catalytic domain-containing protein [Trichonephila clavipes]|uniref:Integrase catalytic domain-containing protein n=1 Tax=Trichonephila clavipes TaxID=2585209 RepID=A0A8X6RTU0_TRICX|nr:integrase catalytic domain-containing protein [Trichonephila clavipes]
MCFLVQNREILPIIDKCSSFLKLQRILAWCVRFKENARNPLQLTTGSLTVAELSTALIFLVRNVQSVSFAKDIWCLERRQPLPVSSNLLTLSPFLDERKILCVGGRLRHSNLPAQQKHPILIPNNHSICDLIIKHYHVLYLHTGTEATLANIRTRFWIVNGRSKVKGIIKQCIQCLKVSAKGKNQRMADLPNARVSIARVFSKVGLDFCGPFHIKLISGRAKKMYKCYICIFVCFVVKAIHLEIVSNLSTEAFIGSLKRFISRRGRPSDIFSDNGTNFVGANNEFRKILKGLFKGESSEKFEDFLASESIQWHFNPPAAPHFGGLWEAGVKSLKSHLKRVVGNNILTHEEFFTLVTQVEAVLNSRPLCSLSEDPNDLALTPAHFLTGSPLTSLPDPDFKGIPMNRLRRWELVQRMTQTFWSRWTSDYLNRLQSRPKWYKGNQKFKVNEVILVKGENNSNLLNWNLPK